MVYQRQHTHSRLQKIKCMTLSFPSAQNLIVPIYKVLGIYFTCDWFLVHCHAANVNCVCVHSTAVAGQREVNRNQTGYVVRVLPLTHQPAASHLPLQTTQQPF